MFTADQLVAHLVGEYLAQSHWMATEKTKRTLAAAVHSVAYFLPFWFLHPSKAAIAVIVGTHFLIDRYRLARFVVFAKNFLAPRETVIQTRIPNADELQGENGHVTQLQIRRNWPKWEDAQATGYPSDVPPWLSFWLLIIADNTLHIVINGLTLRYL
jgi:hypothetical protein